MGDDAMSGRPVEPTDSNYELAAGRIALWLDQADLVWLSGRCDCDDSTPEADRDRCARVRFRASAALHKARISEE